MFILGVNAASLTLIPYPYSGPSLPIAETITTPFAVSSQTLKKQWKPLLIHVVSTCTCKSTDTIVQHLLVIETLKIDL